MACTLGNKCAKNLSKRTVLIQLIIKNVVTCFFLEHSVVTVKINVYVFSCNANCASSLKAIIFQQQNDKNIEYINFKY